MPARHTNAATAIRRRNFRMLAVSSFWNSSHTTGIEIMRTRSIAHVDACEPWSVSDRAALMSAPVDRPTRSGIHKNQQAEAVKPRPYSFPGTYPPESIAMLATAELSAYKEEAPNK